MLTAAIALAASAAWAGEITTSSVTPSSQTVAQGGTLSVLNGDAFYAEFNLSGNFSTTGTGTAPAITYCSE